MASWIDWKPPKGKDDAKSGIGELGEAGELGERGEEGELSSEPRILPLRLSNLWREINITQLFS